MRTAFFGSPAIAIPALHALAETTEVVGVVCQPDRPAGRGLQLTAPAVKRAALELGLEVHQPVKVKTGALDEWLATRRVDAAIVLAYGRILPKRVLDVPPLGCINLHASLLPKFRGAAPINWAIIRGESRTGISLMKMTEGLDSGPVYSHRAVDIGSRETAGELTARLAELAALVVTEDLPKVLSGELEAVDQDESEATLAPPITAELATVAWDRPAVEIANLTRGLLPKPGAHTTIRGKSLKLLEVSDEGRVPEAAPPGTVFVAKGDMLLAATSAGAIRIERAQVEGRKALNARDLINGRVMRLGDQLGS